MAQNSVHKNALTTLPRGIFNIMETLSTGTSRPTSHHEGVFFQTDITTNLTSSWLVHVSHGPLNVLDGCMVLAPVSGGFTPWDNPDNVVSQEVERRLDEVVGVVCLPLLFFISVPSNILNMLVFWKQGLRERINLCLFCLSLSDLLYMLFSFVYNVDKLHLQGAGLGPVSEFILNHGLGGLRGFSWLSGFISMLIACERCLCVVSPLRSQTMLKTRTTAVILLLATGIILTGVMLMGLRWSVACVFDPKTNITSKVYSSSDFYAQNKAQLDVLSLLVGTIQPLIFVTVVLATTIVTSVKLKKIVSWREESSSSKLSKREVALTRTLIAVSILYVVCSIPVMMIDIGLMFVSGVSVTGRFYNLLYLFHSLSELGSYVNATFNFFVYCCLGSRYKETLRAIFHCRG